jgi:hypothetical protein
MTLDCQNLATATQKMRDVEDDLILHPDLDIDAYLMTFDGKISSRKDNRANVMSFWRWVQLKKLRPDNIALGAAKIVSSREEKQEKGKRRPTFTEKERNDYMRLIQDPNAWCQGSETGKRTRCRRGGKDTLPRLDASRIRDGHGRLCHIRGR